MRREFWHTALFDNQWNALGCTDDDLASLQNYLCSNPQVGAVIRGTGGVRKVRIALEGRGKRGGARVLYADVVIFESIALLAVYAKNEKENISEEERQTLKRIMERIKGGK
ncbi:MAG: type II toxin-antitoxin system RelE/ParE family toxin [Oscillospiraceae bacterium]|jgi:hypothetical protein|nr:type II toxin-antitoxin system RelE/ParE family toxin [Oscillospiraceae bacterium]